MDQGFMSFSFHRPFEVSLVTRDPACKDNANKESLGYHTCHVLREAAPTACRPGRAQKRQVLGGGGTQHGMLCRPLSPGSSVLGEGLTSCCPLLTGLGHARLASVGCSVLEPRPCPPWEAAGGCGAGEHTGFLVM